MIASKKKRELHGQYGTRAYITWQNMKQRCNNPNNDNYNHYGGRGIKVCKRWNDSFSNFLEDMGERPSNTSINRIDNNGDYKPSNCEWSTDYQQSYNKRTRSDSKTGASGVVWNKQFNRYRSVINVKGKQIYLGVFASLDKAIDARKKAEIKYWSVS